MSSTPWWGPREGQVIGRTDQYPESVFRRMEINSRTTSQTWVTAHSTFSFSGNSSPLWYDEPEKAEEPWVRVRPEGSLNLVTHFPNIPEGSRPQTEPSFHLKGASLDAAIKGCLGMRFWKPAAGSPCHRSSRDTPVLSWQGQLDRGKFHRDGKSLAQWHWGGRGGCNRCNDPTVQPSMEI